MVASQVEDIDACELVGEASADTSHCVAINEGAVGDKGDDALIRDAVAGPADGADVGVVEAVFVGGSGFRGVGVGDAGIQQFVFEILIVVVRAVLPDRIRRISSDDAYGGFALTGDAFVVLGEHFLVAGGVVVAGFGELEGVGENNAVEGEIGRPFRAWDGGYGMTQGVALGWYGLPLWGGRVGGAALACGEDCLFCGFALEGVEGFLDVDGGDVVGEEDDLVGVEFVLVFAEQVLGFDDAAFHTQLEQADDEGAGAGEGIDEGRSR